MRILLRFLFVAAIVCSLPACRFKDAVFTEGFSQVDPALGGVWTAEGEHGDPRKMEFAVCAPLDADRLLLHHPSGARDGIYYEARAIKVRDRQLLQLRVLATFSDGLPKADAERYTLLWLERDADGQTIHVRALGGDGLKGKGPDETKKLLEDSASDWSKLFGDALVFRRLKDK